MKKYFLIFLFLFSFLITNAQKKVSSNEPRYGYCITAGGIIFTVSGLLTTPEYMFVPNPGQTYISSGGQGTWVKKPFFDQGARSLCIVTGVSLTFTGVITSLMGY